MPTGGATNAQDSEFCQTWNDVGPYIEVGLLSASMVDVFYNTMRRQAQEVLENPNVPSTTKRELEELFPGAGRAIDDLIPASLLSKLGNHADNARAWFVKYADDLPDDVESLARQLETNIGDKQIYRVFEDPQGRLVVMAESTTSARRVVTLEKVKNGQFNSFTYNNAYQQGGTGWKTSN